MQGLLFGLLKGDIDRAPLKGRYRYRCRCCRHRLVIWLFKGGSKTVQVPLKGIGMAADMVLTLIVLKQ